MTGEADGTVEQRAYEVHLPGGKKLCHGGEHLPIVLAIDGTTTNKPYTGMAVDNRINAEADRDGFMVVYPLPKPRSFAFGAKTIREWNAPGVGALPTDPSYNDVDYVKSVIDDVTQRFHPKPGIHTANLSMGGEFQMKLDNDLPAGTFADHYIVCSTVFQPPADVFDCAVTWRNYSD